VLCAFEITRLLSVVFLVLRAVYKFDFRLVIRGTADKGDQWNGRAVIETDVFDRVCMFSPDRLR